MEDTGSMKFQIRSEVRVPGLGVVKHSHEQDFPADSNVFGRVLEYHEYMRRTFPGCEFKLVDTKEVKA